MGQFTDLSTLEVIDSERPLGEATLSSVAISKSGAYFATGDENGIICVYRTDNQDLVRSYHLDGQAHILGFVQLQTKTVIYAATKIGRFQAWQLDAPSTSVRLQGSFKSCVNAVAFSSRNQFLAISVGLEVHLYNNPWLSVALPTPDKVWAGVVETNSVKNFLSEPLAVGLHFTLGDDLLISYLAGHCLVRTTAPYNVVYRKGVELPHRIGSVCMSPNGRYAVSTNLNDGLDLFDLQDQEFKEPTRYLSTTGGEVLSNESRLIQPCFLDETFLVTGHREAVVCVFQLSGQAFGDPLEIGIPGAHRGFGVEQVAAGFYNRMPFIVALNGRGKKSRAYVIAAPSFRDPVNLALARNGMKPKTSWAVNTACICRNLNVLLSVLFICIGIIVTVAGVYAMAKRSYLDL